MVGPIRDAVCLAEIGCNVAKLAKVILVMDQPLFHLWVAPGWILDFPHKRVVLP